jgi:hypothetical protein
LAGEAEVREARLPRTGIHEQHPRDTNGADRCRRFVENHAAAQAARVEPALTAMAKSRRIALAVRRARWLKDREALDLLRAPRHIQATV